jgi:hypothetical protein
MSGTSGTVVDLDGEDAIPPGQDRRRAVALAFVMFLSVGSTAVSRDGPAATAPVEPPHLLIVSPDVSDVVLFGFPDRLVNEPLPNLPYVTVVVRGTEGLALNTVSERSPVKGWMVTWTEGGTAYSLSSDRRDLSDLLRVAGSLR